MLFTKYRVPGHLVLWSDSVQPFSYYGWDRTTSVSDLLLPSISLNVGIEHEKA